jgi:bud site selection protein 20
LKNSLPTATSTAFYESEANYKSHQKSKPHKRRVKAMKEEPYSQKEAEAAAGYGTAVAKKTDAEDTMIVEE